MKITTGDGREITYESPRKAMVQPQVSGDPRQAKLFASPGEYEPFSFLLRPLESLEEVMINSTELRGSGGVIPQEDVVVTSVEGFHDEGRRILMRLGRTWNMSAHSTEYFWCTVRLPDGASPGEYSGPVMVTSKGKPVGQIDVTLEVLLDPPGRAPVRAGLQLFQPQRPAIAKGPPGRHAPARDDHGRPAVQLSSAALRRRHERVGRVHRGLPASRFPPPLCTTPRR